MPAARILEARQLSPKQHCLFARTTTTRYHAINDRLSPQFPKNPGTPPPKCLSAAKRRPSSSSEKVRTLKNPPRLERFTETIQAPTSHKAKTRSSPTSTRVPQSRRRSRAHSALTAVTCSLSTRMADKQSQTTARLS